MLSCAHTCMDGNQEIDKGNHKWHWSAEHVKKFRNDTKAHVRVQTVLAASIKHIWENRSWL